MSFQAVSRWLAGQAIPEQDKLLGLAEIVNLEPEVLSSGEALLQAFQLSQFASLKVSSFEHGSRNLWIVRAD